MKKWKKKKNAVVVVNVKNAVAMKHVNVDVTVQMIAIAMNVIVKTAIVSYK